MPSARHTYAAVALSLAAPRTVDAQQLPPHASWTTLSYANGFAAGYYDTIARRVRGMREHVYAHRDAASTTRELMYDLYFGLRADGDNLWLTSRPIVEAGYDGETGIARVVQTHGDLRATQYFFTPFGADAAAMIALIEIENVGDAPLADAAVFAIQNLHVGGGDAGTAAESISWIDGAYEERGAGGLLVHRPVPDSAIHAASPNNPYLAVTGGGHLVETAASGTIDDAVAGFEWPLDGLAAGARTSFAVVIGHRGDGDRAALDAALAPLLDDGDNEAEALLADARADWAAFHDRALEPSGISDDERAVYRRQLAILRMGQVREPGAPYGQIIASLPPGIWNIAWVRDQAYATTALIHAGLLDEAEAALDFVLGGDAGTYICCDDDGGPWVGVDYALSVTRYYGDGTEESDWNERGPNIEFDGFGLTLMAIEQFLAAGGDPALLERHAGAIFEGTAEVLVSLIEPGDLVRADSSIWETHWYDGGRRHHAYTQAAASAGLKAAARLADRAGRLGDVERYFDAGARIGGAMASRMVDEASGVLRQSLEERTGFLDGAAIEAFNWNVLPPAGPAARATLDAFRAGLWNSVVGHGYRRNDDGGPYDEREWVVIDLRIAHAARRAGRAEHADELIAWITDQARLNFDLVPENYDKTTGDYQGEVPMTGFGAGAYVTALWERTAPVDPPGPDAGPPLDDDGGPPIDGDGGAPIDGGGGSCGCRGSDTGGGGGGWPIALAGLALAIASHRRRRRTITR